MLPITFDSRSISHVRGHVGFIRDNYCIGGITTQIGQNVGGHMRQADGYTSLIDTWHAARDMPLGGRRYPKGWGIDGRGYIYGGDVFGDPIVDDTLTQQELDQLFPFAVRLAGVRMMQFNPPFSWLFMRTGIENNAIASSDSAAGSFNGVGFTPGVDPSNIWIQGYWPRGDVTYRGGLLPHRLSQGAATIWHNRCYTFGGLGTSGIPVPTMRINLPLGSISTLPGLDTRNRAGLTAETLNNLIYHYGGRQSQATLRDFARWTVEYDPQTETPTDMTNMPLPWRTGLASFIDQDGCYAVGGEQQQFDQNFFDTYGERITYLDRLHKFTPRPAPGTWTRKQDMKMFDLTRTYLGGFPHAFRSRITGELVPLTQRRDSKGLTL